MNKILFLTALLILSLTKTYSQQTYFVNEATINSGAGLSWADAFKDLQLALAAASSGDEIWVAKGTYRPTSTTDSYVTFNLKSGVKLLGGFAGDETTLTQRNWVTNVTTLNGNIGNPLSRVDNSQHIVTGYNLENTTALDGFVISEGYSEEGYGAALGLGANAGNTARPLIANCRFINNYAYSGGAVYIGSLDQGDYVHPVFRNCSFEHNNAYEKGGAFMKSGPASPGDTFSMENCAFRGNRVPTGKGGAIYFDDPKNSSIRLVGCIFERDSSWEGGAIASNPSLPGHYSTTFIFDSCTFYRNWALEGGAFHFRGVYDGPGHELNYKINNCVFEENISKNSSGGRI